MDPCRPERIVPLFSVGISFGREYSLALPLMLVYIISMSKQQWVLYNGRTYKIIGQCMVDFAPGWILEGGIRVEKSLVEAY